MRDVSLFRERVRDREGIIKCKIIGKNFVILYVNPMRYKYF